jgi:hypothetical protein
LLHHHQRRRASSTQCGSTKQLIGYGSPTSRQCFIIYTSQDPLKLPLTPPNLVSNSPESFYRFPTGTSAFRPAFNSTEGLYAALLGTKPTHAAFPIIEKSGRVSPFPGRTVLHACRSENPPHSDNAGLREIFDATHLNLRIDFMPVYKWLLRRV